MLLDKELVFYGCVMDAGEFNDLLADMLNNMYRGTSPEQLLYRPEWGALYCNAIRARSINSLPNEMILRRLRNIEKAGAFKGI